VELGKCHFLLIFHVFVYFVVVGYGSEFVQCLSQLVAKLG